MKLDRNINATGRGKYALIKLRETDAPLEIIKGAVTPDRFTKLPVDLGDTEDTEFFVLRLKDKYSEAALLAYADQASEDGNTEYADEIYNLARRAGLNPNKRRPD